MKYLPGFEEFACRADDVVITPDWVARDVVKFFKPAGKILDPCCGDGAFSRYLPQAEWCEIRKGRDFFDWFKKVDWIVSNPPYSNFSAFLRHSFRVASNIVYLIPINKVFSSARLLEDLRVWGGIPCIYYVGDGHSLGFPVEGYCIGAVHFRRAYKGRINFVFHQASELESVRQSAQEMFSFFQDANPHSRGAKWAKAA